MKWILPHPFMTAALFVMWLLLNQSLALGPALVGAVLALLGGGALSMLQPRHARMGRAGVALRLAGKVLIDIVRSNLAVASVILHRRQDRRAGFIRIPLALRDPGGLAALACILTATPGTAWVEFNPDEGWLLLHVLDLIDEDSWVHIVKDRYEGPLMEIFQ